MENGVFGLEAEFCQFRSIPSDKFKRLDNEGVSGAKEVKKFLERNGRDVSNNTISVLEAEFGG